MSGIDLSQFHQVFFEESFEWLDAMESELVDLDPQNVESETINTIFRAAHSIKGGSGTFGFTDVSGFTHVLETLLDEIRDGKRHIDQKKVDLFLSSVDCLRAMLGALQDEQPVDSTEANRLKAEFEAMLAADESKTEPVALKQAEAPVSQDEIAPESDSSDGFWRIKFVPGRDIIRTGNEPFRIVRELASFGDLKTKVFVDLLPEFSQLDPEQCYLYWVIEAPLSIKREDIDEVFEWNKRESAYPRS